MTNRDAAFFERALLLVVDRFWAIRGEREGFRASDAELARRAFSGVADPVRKWRYIRGKGRHSKPQGLTIQDAWSLAQAVGLDLSYLIHVAEQESRAGLVEAPILPED